MPFTAYLMVNAGVIVPAKRELEATDSLYDYFRVSSSMIFFDCFEEPLFPLYKARHPQLTEQLVILSCGARLKVVQLVLVMLKFFLFTGMIVSIEVFVFGPGSRKYRRPARTLARILFYH